MKNFPQNILILGVGIMIGVIFDFLPIDGALNNTVDVANSKQVREMGDFKYINPLLECEVAEGTIDAPKINFKEDLSRFVDGLREKNGVTEIAAYFRDLNNGPAFGYRETMKFIPASLLKVPVMIAYYSYSEDDPSVLGHEIAHLQPYAPPEKGTQLIPPKSELVVGEKYTAEELIRHSVVYSDNQAVTHLIEELPPKYLRELYRVLGVDSGVLNGPGGELSVREYASFFRVLFNSSFLSRKNSEKALGILAQTQFDRGIVAGVPSGIAVAHKFGEGGDVEQHQIHDCGIVYYPKHPYLLCIMTRGSDIAELESTIAAISGFVYSRFGEQYEAQQ